MVEIVCLGVFFIWKVFFREEEFSNWFVENIKIFEEKIGVEFEDIEREYQIGSYFVDIVVRDVNSEGMVIIENQFEKINYDYFGKIFIYVLGLDVKIIVWIVEKFLEEYKQVLNWFNENIGQDIGFFGIEVKVVKIGDFFYVVDFDIVVMFNQWRKISKSVIE